MTHPLRVFVNLRILMGCADPSNITRGAGAPISVLSDPGRWDSKLPLPLYADVRTFR